MYNNYYDISSLDVNELNLIILKIKSIQIKNIKIKFNQDKKITYFKHMFVG